MYRPSWHKLPWFLYAAAAACAPNAAPRAVVSPLSAPGSAATPVAGAAAAGAKGDSTATAALPSSDPAAAAATPQLQIAVAPMAEHTGGEFGIKVPMLLVTLRNSGSVPLSVPRPGVDLIASLRVVIRSQDAPAQVEQRRVRLYKPWEVSLQPLAPAGELRQVLSPLSREQRDAPLAPGRYTIGVCVIPLTEALYPSPFLGQFGGTCSRDIELVVRRGR